MTTTKTRKRHPRPIDRDRILALRATGLSYPAIARVMNCTPGRAWQVVTGYVMPRSTERRAEKTTTNLDNAIATSKGTDGERAR